MRGRIVMRVHAEKIVHLRIVLEACFS